jgi:hypothetical protein
MWSDTQGISWKEEEMNRLFENSSSYSSLQQPDGIIAKPSKYCIRVGIHFLSQIYLCFKKPCIRFLKAYKTNVITPLIILAEIKRFSFITDFADLGAGTRTKC